MMIMAWWSGESDNVGKCGMCCWISSYKLCVEGFPELNIIISSYSGCQMKICFGIRSLVPEIYLYSFKHTDGLFGKNCQLSG